MSIVAWLALACTQVPAPEPVVPSREPTGHTGPASTTTTSHTGVADDTLRWTTSEADTYVVGLTAAELVGKAGQDITVSWAGLREDLSGVEAAPGDVAEVLLLDPKGDDVEALLAILARSGARPSDVVEWWTATPGAAGHVTLTDFTALGAPFVPAAYFEEASRWVVVLRGGDGRMLAVASLRAGSEGVSLVSVTDDTSTWEFAHVAGPGAPLPAGSAPRLDWSGLDLDGFGDPLDAARADELVLFSTAPDAPFDPTSPIEAQALSHFHRALGGEREAELSWLRADDQTTFDGFAEGTVGWLALRCGACSNPVPMSLLRLEVGP